MAIVSNFATQEHRTLKPLFTKTQATFQDWPVDPSRHDIMPGMVACMGPDGVRPSTGAERPLGLFSTYRTHNVWEVPSAGVLVFGGGAMADVSRSVIDKDADWEAAEATLKSGGRVLLESDANGRLTVGDGNPVCMLMSVGQAKITVSEAPEALVAEPPQPAALTIGKTDFNGTTFAGKNLGELTSGLTASVEGTNVVFGGTINHVPDWTEFSAAEEDRTGYACVRPDGRRAGNDQPCRRHSKGHEGVHGDAVRERRGCREQDGRHGIHVRFYRLRLRRVRRERWSLLRV